MGRLKDAVSAAYTFFNANPMEAKPGEGNDFWNYTNYMGLWNKTCNFDFFSKIFLTIWKSSSSRSRKPESEVSKLKSRFLKKSWRSKNGPKFAILFLCFLTTWCKLWFQTWYKMIDTKFLQCEALNFFRNFATYAFYINARITWSKSKEII